MTPSAMPANVTPRKPSKGPPPLPTAAVTALPALPHDAAVEATFFLEGIDGRADSLPSAEVYAVDDGPNADADATPVSRDSEWLEAKEAIEDPARTRRRKAARVGVACGAIVLLTLTAAAAFMRPRASEASATWSASPAFVTTAAPSPAASAIVATRTAAPSPLAAVSPSRPPVRAMTASAAAASPRAVVGKGTSSSPAKRAASSSPKDSGERAKHPPTPRASSTRKHP